MEFRKPIYLRVLPLFPGIQPKTTDAIHSMDKELLSNLLNTSEILSKVLTSLCFFSCLNLVLAFLLVSFILYYYDSKRIYGNVAFIRTAQEGDERTARA